jgi:hypothetical protein
MTLAPIAATMAMATKPDAAIAPGSDLARQRLATSCPGEHIGARLYPAEGLRGMIVPLTSMPYSRSSYFCCLRLRQPLPAVIGGGINGGRKGNPPSPAGSGEAADAS